MGRDRTGPLFVQKPNTNNTPNSINPASQPAARSVTAPSSGFLPAFVPLPARGGDAVCGMSRAFWYAQEAKGLIRLKRYRTRGQVRGRALLPVAKAIALFESMPDTPATLEANEQRAKRTA